MLRGTALLLAILAFTPVLVVRADQPEPWVEYLNLPPQAGWMWFGGWVSEVCSQATFYVYSGEALGSELLGKDVANWSIKPFYLPTHFAARFHRPLREGETITVYAECEGGRIVQDTFTVIPFESWPDPFVIWDPRVYFPVITLDAPVAPGSTTLQGQLLDDTCAYKTLYVYSGVEPKREFLGSSIINPDGTFSVSLERPIQDETVMFYIDCTVNVPYGYIVEEGFFVPPIVPEPGTVLLVGGGLGMLALWAEKRGS